MSPLVLTAIRPIRFFELKPFGLLDTPLTFRP